MCGDTRRSASSNVLDRPTGRGGAIMGLLYLPSSEGTSRGDKKLESLFDRPCFGVMVVSNGMCGHFLQNTSSETIKFVKWPGARISVSLQVASTQSSPICDASRQGGRSSLTIHMI